MDTRSIFSKLIEIQRTKGSRVLLQKILQKLTTKILSIPAKINSDPSVKIIANSQLFRADFYAPQIQNQVGAIRNYVETKNASRRKPFPGFHPGIYMELHGLKKSREPLLDFILNNQPEGPWKVNVLSSKKQTYSFRDNLKVVLHIHVHYPDMLPDILSRLNSNTIKPHLYLTVTSAKLENEVQKYVENSGFEVRTIIVPNKGRDIAPFLVSVGKELVEKYEYIGHIHTKKSLQFHDSVGKNWHNFLIENVLGSENNRMMDASIDYFENYKSISLIFPDDPNTCGWDLNRALGEKFGKLLDLPELPTNFNFPIGSMFWIKSDALTQLVKLDFTIDDFVDEPLPHDGTIGHAIERIISFLPAAIGKTYAVTNTQGVSR